MESDKNKTDDTNIRRQKQSSVASKSTRRIAEDPLCKYPTIKYPQNPPNYNI